MTPQIKLLSQFFDLKKAIDFSLTNIGQEKWSLKAIDRDNILVFTMAISDAEAYQLLMYLSKLPNVKNVAPEVEHSSVLAK